MNKKYLQSSFVRLTMFFLLILTLLCLQPTTVLAMEPEDEVEDPELVALHSRVVALEELRSASPPDLLNFLPSQLPAHVIRVDALLPGGLELVAAAGAREALAAPQGFNTPPPQQGLNTPPPQQGLNTPPPPQGLNTPPPQDLNTPPPPQGLITPPPPPQSVHAAAHRLPARRLHPTSLQPARYLMPRPLKRRKLAVLDPQAGMNFMSPGSLTLSARVSSPVVQDALDGLLLLRQVFLLLPDDEPSHQLKFHWEDHDPPGRPAPFGL